MGKHMMMFVLVLDFYFQFQIALNFVFNSSSIDMDFLSF